MVNTQLYIWCKFPFSYNCYSFVLNKCIIILIGIKSLAEINFFFAQIEDLFSERSWVAFQIHNYDTSYNYVHWYDTTFTNKKLKFNFEWTYFHFNPNNRSEK